VNVSIIVAAYNAEATLPETIASIEGQTHPGWEAIVVDDGSTDGTRTVAEAAATRDSRIRAVSQSNGGEGAARNAGLSGASYDWLLFLDADDRIAPTHLERMTEAVLAGPALDAVHCGWISLDPSGRAFGESECPESGADLARADPVPSDSFDCVILTQTLQLIYDVPAALATVHRILKPGGVVLATVPGITKISLRYSPDSWFWAFTVFSARRLFEGAFPAGAVRVEGHGNVLAACAFLHGLAVEEVRREDLDYVDPDYEVSITIRALKLADAR
jgi:glycosyltransferase involved in cell wall biosynthesis